MKLEAARFGYGMSRRFIGISWKVGGLYACLIAILIALTLAASYHLAESLLRARLERQRLAIATSFSDSAAAHVAGKNFLAVHALASKYTFLEGTVYAFVRDSDGRIVAHSFSDVPEDVHRGLSVVIAQIQQRDLALFGKPVHEIAVPILDGQLGLAYVGFSKDVSPIELADVSSFLPVVGLIFLAGIALSFALAAWMLRPITRLSASAEIITRGDLENVDLTDWIRSRDEIGTLAISLERMRSSLKAALSRLAREVS